MYKAYQQLILDVRDLLAIGFMIIWVALIVLTMNAAIERMAKNPRANDDPISVIFVSVFLIMPVAVAVPGGICFFVWAPIDLLLGFMSGKPTLLFWLKEEGDER